MANSTRTNQNSKQTRPMRPALTPEAEEQQMIHLAMMQARDQLAAGTAPAPVVTHFLKLASSKEKLEMEIKELEKELIVAKTKSMESAARVEELYENAIEAMKRYGGHNEEA